MPAISVLIPCYNVAGTVDETLASLVAQSLGDFEVILVDDGSTDGTLGRLEAWAMRDRRMRVLACPHRGIIPALNDGLEACRSAYVARLDADDRALPLRLERQVELLDKHPELAVVTCLVRGFPAESLGVEFSAYIAWLNSLQSDEDLKHNMFVQSPLAHPSVAYRRQWVRQVGGYQEHGWAEDYDLWVRLYLAGANFMKVPEVLLEWRDHPHRLTHTDGRYSEFNDLRLKANYLAHGPLAGRHEVWMWGAGEFSSQLGDQLLRLGCPLAGYVIDRPPGQDHAAERVPYIHAEEFDKKLKPGAPPAVLVAENIPADRERIIQHLESMSLRQGRDFWVVG